jgi:RNA methyltransferase, TrmH family
MTPMPLTKAEVARLRSLRDKRHRDELGLFVVEGKKVVRELAAAGLAFEEILATPGWDGPGAREVSEADMARISHFPTPSPVLAIGRVRRAPLPEGALDTGLTLALDGVQDPGNVGTLVRIADWFALARVVLSPDCADPWSQKAINASMGSFARVATHVADLPEVLGRTSAPILGCDLVGEDVRRVGVVADAVIVIGSEGRGLSAGVRARLTRRITIPRHGKAESLNAAAAAAIICERLRAGP